jgi:hypothetical protein
MLAGENPITTELAMRDYTSPSAQAKTYNSPRINQILTTENGTMPYACKYNKYSM